jgi:hypothetical protein
MAQDFERDLIRDGVSPEKIQAQIKRSRGRMTSAPVAILLCLDMSEMDSYPDLERQQAERMMAIQSAAADRFSTVTVGGGSNRSSSPRVYLPVRTSTAPPSPARKAPATSASASSPTITACLGGQSMLGSAASKNPGAGFLRRVRYADSQIPAPLQTRVQT